MLYGCKENLKKCGLPSGVCNFFFVLVEHFRMFSVLHKIFALSKMVKQLKIESYEKIIDSSFKFGYFQHSGNGR